MTTSEVDFSESSTKCNQNWMFLTDFSDVEANSIIKTGTVMADHNPSLIGHVISNIDNCK